ncbi:MAG TPA: galactonate dehydratase [Phycisphaerae bacterium]|nr:galactonate dehydratase [Phycisphaerae bacterium]
MRIANYRLLHVRPRFLLVRIETDTGLVGWGEATLEGNSLAVAAAVDQLMAMIEGEDPRRIEHLWQRMYRAGFYRGGPVLCSAISGVEHALWDILGKSLNVPVHVLLGGAVRDRIRMYGQIHGNTPDAVLEQYRQRRAEGLTAFKLPIPGPVKVIDTPATVERLTAILAALREEAGDDVNFALDAHGRLSPAMSIQVAAALAPYRPMFLEEPCLPENVDAMVTIARSTTVPIATGERLMTRWGFREVIEKQAATILQPDPAHVGGILETRKVAAMGETYYMAVAPHCPLSAVALAACLQVDAVLPNFLVQEFVTLGEDLLVEPFKLEDGHLPVPQGPGLGIEIDETKLESLIYDGRWRTPEYRHDDGSVADW